MLTGSRTHKMFRACTINPFTATACKISGLRDIIYLSLHCHHQNDSCIKMGSDESHFNVSVGSGGQSHKTVSTNHNLFEEKGEPKRYRTEVLPLTSLTSYR